MGFFRLFDLLLGGQTDRFYLIYWIFPTFWLFELVVVVKMNNFPECIGFFLIFWPLAGRSNWSILLDILNFFDFSTFRPLAGRSNWSILLDILDFFDFSTFRPLAGRSKWLILLNIYIVFFPLFDFSTSWLEINFSTFWGAGCLELENILFPFLRYENFFFGLRIRDHPLQKFY